MLTSPSQRALDTARLAGFANANVNPDLAEWDYGEYEGRTTADIQNERPGWNVFVHGCPGGEDVAAVSARADRIIAVFRADLQRTIVFSSAHFLRVLGARWAGWPGAAGAGLALEPASISILGSEHGGTDPVLRLWNETDGV